MSKWNKERRDVAKKYKLTTSTSAKHFIAEQTYTNLLRLLRGFCGYASCMLLYSDEEIFVPRLHSDQSSLVGNFSRVRALKRDFTHLYSGGILHQFFFFVSYG